MIGLKSARVIIVDDVEDEALPIMIAFAKKGIPCAYFHGTNVKELPEEKDKFIGIRLAILDMDLVGTGADEKSKISTLISCLERLLRVDNGPYIALIWTNNPWLRDRFEENIFSNSNLPNPIDIIMLTKAACKKNGKLDISIIEQKIENTFKSFYPLKMIQAWEEKIFEASTEVSNVLCGQILEEKDPKKWRDDWKLKTLNLMYALAKEVAGENLDKNSVLRGLYYSLNPLHSDRMEHLTSDLSVLLGSDAEEILKYNQDCGIERKAMINAMLHLAFEETSTYVAGNMYRFASNKVPRWGFSYASLLSDLVQSNYYSTKEKKKNISSLCKYVLLEISASCDQVQGNVRAARFLSGLIVPKDELKKIKEPKDYSNFIWRIGPLYIQIEDLKGIYYLYFSARHLVTCPVVKIVNMKPFARLRSEALADIQSWFARHASRPGLILLKDK
jgi:hypothetical protein